MARRVPDRRGTTPCRPPERCGAAGPVTSRVQIRGTERSPLNFGALPRSRPLCCQDACRSFFGAGAGGEGSGGGRVVALGRVREWLSRRSGVFGCEPAALATESFPACPPGPRRLSL